MTARGALPHPPPPSDPADLDRFPARALSAERWLRAHVDRAPRPSCWWFASASGEPDSGGRFDLPPPSGTCYLGSTEEVAARERVGPWLRDQAVLETVLTTADGPVVVTPTRVTARRAATLQVKRAGRWVNRALWAGPGYAVTQAWASAFHGAGFDALVYEPRFTNGGRARSVAVFGPAGRPRPSPPVERSIPLADVLARVGIRVVGVPPASPPVLAASHPPPEL